MSGYWRSTSRRDWSCILRPATVRARWSARCCIAGRRCRRISTPGGWASSTGSTRTPRACCSLPRPARCVADLGRQFHDREGGQALPGTGLGHSAACTRVIDEPIGGTRSIASAWPCAAGASSVDALRGDRVVEGRCVGARASRHRPHASDSRAPDVARPSHRRGPGIRATDAITARSASTGRRCTRRRSASGTRQRRAPCRSRLRWPADFAAVLATLRAFP